MYIGPQNLHIIYKNTITISITLKFQPIYVAVENILITYMSYKNNKKVIHVCG